MTCMMDLIVFVFFALVRDFIGPLCKMCFNRLLMTQLYVKRDSKRLPFNGRMFGLLMLFRRKGTHLVYASPTKWVFGRAGYEIKVFVQVRIGLVLPVLVAGYRTYMVPGCFTCN